jgi:hypothetical protein
LAENIYEDIARRVVSVSLALIIGILGLAVLAILTIVFQYFHWMGFDLTQSFTDIWLWILFTGSAVCVTLINYGLYRKRPQKQEAPLETSETALDKQTMSQLTGLARGGFIEGLKANLHVIGIDLDTRGPTRLVLWAQIDPTVRRSLITDTEEYDALDQLWKSLEQRNANLYSPDFEMWDKLCKGHYERLKRTELFPFS